MTLKDKCPYCKHLIADHISSGCFWSDTCKCTLTNELVKVEFMKQKALNALEKNVSKDP